MSSNSEPIVRAIVPAGDIRTYPDNILEIRVFDCMKREWTDLKVPYRRTLLGLMHGNANYAVGEVETRGAVPNDLRPIRVRIGENSEIQVALDIAGSSRSHGRFIFSDAEVGMYYFHNPAKPEDTNSGRINYGSLLLSAGRRLFGRNCKVKIVTDGRDGDYSQDNPYFIGDSHGKAGKALLEQIALLSGEGTEAIGNVYNPCQIRVGFYKEYVGKATVSYLPQLDEEGIDLVLPLSCFKIKKPPVGDRTGRVAIGILNDSETRIANVNYQFWQWFSYSVVQEEVIPLQQQRATELAQARDSIRNLARILGQPLGQLASSNEWNPESNADSPEDSEDAGDEEDRYLSKLAIIVRGDISGKLLDHPWVVETVRRQFRKRWLELAVNGPIKFYSYMAQPCELLPDDTFTCQQLPLGEYIVFRNPIRHWGDIRVWRNVRIVEVENQLQLSRYAGVVWMNHKTAAKAGGDFDGDWFQFLNVDDLPRVATEAKTFSTTKFGEPPTVVKPEKVPIRGSLEEVALRATEELVGKVSNGIARAAALLSHLPDTPEEYYRPAKQMIKRAIEELSQQLQLSLDRLKFETPFDPDKVEYWLAFLNEVQETERTGRMPWLRDSKENNDAYLTRPLAVDDNAEDTISLMIKNVNAIWQPWNDFPKRENLLSFRTLFPYKYGRNVAPEQWSFTQAQVNQAETIRNRYSDLVKSAIQLENEGRTNEARSYRIKAGAVIRDERSRIETSVSSGNATIDSWLLAYWHVAHATRGRGTGSIVFNLFANEIAQKLLEIEPVREFMIVGLGEGEYQGQIIQHRRGTVQIYPMTVRGRTKKGVRINWNDETYGTYKTVGHLVDSYEGDFDIGSTFVADLRSLTTTIQLFLTDGRVILIGTLASEWIERILSNEPLRIVANSTGEWWNRQRRLEKIQVRGQLASEPERPAETWRLIGTISRNSPTLRAGEFATGTARSVSTLIKGETVPGEEPI